MLVLGLDAVSGKDGVEILNLAKKIAEKFNFIQENWNGFNLLQKNSGLINGLELHFTNAAGFYGIAKNTKLAFLLGVDDIDFDALNHAFKIYIGSHGDKGAHHADIILPASAFSEKEAIYVNLEGRAQKTTRAIFAPNDAKEDWQIVNEIAHVLSLDLGFRNIDELRELMKNKSSVFANVGGITKAKWHSSQTNKALEASQKIQAQDFDFYSTNVIARASRALAKCNN